MAEATRKKIVYLIFVTALIYGAFHFLSHKAKTGTDYSAAAIAPITGELPTPGDSIGKPDFDWQRDPFAYGRASSDGSGMRDRVPRFHLAAVSESNGKMMAIINGEPLGLGDVVDGWTLSALTKTGATLTFNGKALELEIGN